jgi:adenylate kinase
VGLRVVVVGIAGVGKSTVVEKAISALSGAKTMVFGTSMFEAAKHLRWVKNRDEMRSLPLEKQKRLQKIAAQEISRAKGRAVFVDTHLFIRTPEGFWPGLPFDVIRALKPTHLILVEAKPEDILSRRTSDKTRYRDVITREEVEDELVLARNLLSTASLVSGAPMLMVMNEEGKVDEAAQKIVDMLRGARK